MMTLDEIRQDVVIETVKRISELQALANQTESEDERRSLQIAIAELQQLVQAHDCSEV